MSPPDVVLYHRTTAANAGAILAGGFQDATGRYMTDREFSGVWLSNIPADVNEGAAGDALLAITLPADVDLEPYEWVEEERHSAFREWLIPAEMLNRRGSVRRLSQEEEDALPARF